MRNSRTITYLVILAIVLTLSVGYAVISAVDMTVSGTAAAATENLDVVFSKAEGSSTKATGTASNLTAGITVSNLTLNETVYVTYTVTNNETDVAASIKQASITNSNTEYFQVTTDATTAKSVAAKGTTTVKVSVKLIKTPVASANNSANITVKFTATPTNNTTT